MKETNIIHEFSGSKYKSTEMQIQNSHTDLGDFGNFFLWSNYLLTLFGFIFSFPRSTAAIPWNPSYSLFSCPFSDNSQSTTRQEIVFSRRGFWSLNLLPIVALFGYSLVTGITDEWNNSQSVWVPEYLVREVMVEWSLHCELLFSAGRAARRHRAGRWCETGLEPVASSTWAQP